MTKRMDYHGMRTRDKAFGPNFRPQAIGSPPNYQKQKPVKEKYAHVTESMSDSDVARAREMARGGIKTADIADVLKRPIAMIRDALSNKKEP